MRPFSDELPAADEGLGLFSFDMAKRLRAPFVLGNKGSGLGPCRIQSAASRRCRQAMSARRCHGTGECAARVMDSATPVRRLRGEVHQGIDVTYAGTDALGADLRRPGLKFTSKPLVRAWVVSTPKNVSSTPEENGIGAMLDHAVAKRG